jgi:hypothetical protein
LPSSTLTNERKNAASSQNVEETIPLQANDLNLTSVEKEETPAPQRRKSLTELPISVRAGVYPPSKPYAGAIKGQSYFYGQQAMVAAPPYPLALPSPALLPQRPSASPQTVSALGEVENESPEAPPLSGTQTWLRILGSFMLLLGLGLGFSQFRRPA